jgi:hypothetical protein
MMIRGRHIAAAVGFLAMTHGAQAQIVCANCFDEPTALAENLITAANWVTQLARMTAQIEQQIAIFQQLSGLTNVNAMAAILNTAGNFNQMSTFGNVPGQLQGEGGGVGAGFQAANGNALPIGSPMPLLNAMQTVYNQRAASLASVQGISSQLLANSNVILAGLRTLQQLIDNQPSSQLMGGMNSRLSAYQGNINSQQYQLQQAQTFANAQQKVFDQREQRAVFCSDAGWANDNPPLTGAALNLGAAHCVGAGTGIFAGAGILGAGLGTGAAAPGTTTATVDIAGFDTAPATTTTAALPVPPIPPAAAPADDLDTF